MTDDAKTVKPVKAEKVETVIFGTNPLEEAAALMDMAAALLDEADGPRPRVYQSIAKEVRALAARLAAL